MNQEEEALHRPVLSRLSRFATVGLTVFLACLLGATAASGQYFGKNRVQYRDFEWKIYHSPHFDVYYYEDAEHLLENTVSLAESAYDELSRMLDYQIDEPTPLIVYATHSAFLQNNIILNGIPEGAQAFATPSQFRMVMPLDLSDRDLLALIKHELTHIFQYHILFRGRVGARLRGGPPLWFMEGMASYIGDDESPSEKKFIRDLVVNDNIPSVTNPFRGYLAYRFGHAVFDFIEERWGKDGVVDFIYEMRNSVGFRVGPALERTFRLDAEDFDAELRRWLRQRYLAELLATGEPGDFGRRFRLGDRPLDTWEFSPEAAPSGDLVAAVTTDRGMIDVSIFDAESRTRIRNLTPGFDKQVQSLSTTNESEAGGDLAFSPDGNTLAMFARREATRSLVLIDVLDGGLTQIIDMDLEQQTSPAWSPEGDRIAFQGNLNGYYDIYEIDLATLEISNLTNDERFDGSPEYSPDGRWLAYSTTVDRHDHIFRLDRNDPSQRFAVTWGEHNNYEPAYSPDSQRLYFTSDRGGVDNIYSIDFSNATLTQFTDAVTAADRPAVLPLPGGGERLVYTGFWKGRYDLYVRDVEEPVSPPAPYELPEGPLDLAAVPDFEPDIEVTIDPANEEPYGGFNFFLEDAVTAVGVDTDQIFVGYLFLTWSDYLGDRRIFGRLGAVDTFSDFNFTYGDFRNRWQWTASLFDTRFYGFFLRENSDGNLEEVREDLYTLTGIEGRAIYPFNRANRVEFSLGYNLREYNGFLTENDAQGNQVVVISPREDDYAEAGVTFVHDTALYQPWGPVTGTLFRVGASYALGGDEGGALFNDYFIDARKYFALTRTVNLAFRLRGNFSEGDFPNVSYVGGFDTIRGFRRNEFAGFNTAHFNAELRFPLINQVQFPFFGLSNIRGNVFFDLGAAWFPDVGDFNLYDDDLDQLDDGLASYGWGLSVNFLGLQLNWDFAKVTDFGDNSDDDFQTYFWIGTRF
ncbi:MAG: hypothetical protein AAGD38_06640 [Acidobacteriota bacterium]